LVIFRLGFGNGYWLMVTGYWLFSGLGLIMVHGYWLLVIFRLGVGNDFGG
jgi:hypothetical protein